MPRAVFVRSSALGRWCLWTLVRLPASSARYLRPVLIAPTCSSCFVTGFGGVITSRQEFYETRDTCLCSHDCLQRIGNWRFSQLIPHPAVLSSTRSIVLPTPTTIGCLLFNKANCADPDSGVAALPPCSLCSLSRSLIPRGVTKAGYGC
ncbi:hypothetical protein EDB84DRAFT_73755 [Lactarius hengduanensis]|nr:hypothetical protein EDB84DRAFT_73755 [Lactarius hengduanensis]